MKRLIMVLNLICFIIMFMITNVNAKENTYTLEMKVINNKDEDINLYILLPKEYILYAMGQDYVAAQYNGANTLIENNIPSIKVNKK